jgi:superfamily II DNA or RNA helicase
VHNCDKAASTNYKDLFFKFFKGRYKYGFSGTPEDKKKPVEWLFLRERLGSIIYHIDRKDVEATGRIIPVKQVLIAVGEDGDRGDKTAYDIAENEQVIQNDDFHSLVAATVAHYPNDRTLIIVDTHEIKSLGQALEKKIDGSKFIFGQTATKERRAAIKSFEDGETRCLIGGKIIKRGLDLRGGADNVILIGGGTKWSNIDQMVGRAVRKNARGWCRVIGFYFMSNHYLYAHSREQLKAMVSMGYDTKVIFKNGIVSGADLIKSKFRVPKG